MLPGIERPEGVEERGAQLEWGSDVVAEMLRRGGFRYIALNPGASYRGLHDSLVNFLGNEAPQMLLCLHEEHAVAIAHGFAKVAGEPMAVALHSNVGLMHATMAIFNAYCDRVPLLLLGATGPVDAASRRPWIDWLHTAADQGALIRNFTKWDDQPASVPAAIESLLRARLLSTTVPMAPVYVCLDAALQEQRLETPVELPDVGRFAPGRTPAPDDVALKQVVDLLVSAERVVILAGRVSRDPHYWQQRIALAERLAARVITDLKVGAAFPTAHPLHVAGPGIFLLPEAAQQIRHADVVLALDWVDLAGTLRQAYEGKEIRAKIVSCSLDQVLHNGWSKDHQGLAPVDVPLLSHPDVVTSLLVERLGAPDAAPPGPVASAAGTGGAGPPGQARVAPQDRDPSPQDHSGASVVTLALLGQALREATASRDVTLVRLPLGWAGGDWEFAHPLDFLGQDGGGGIGSGPGMAVGAALALAGSGRLAVAVLGDGDFLMGVTALWTAAHYGIPILIVVANNRSYFNDELHQDRVAQFRGRPRENRWIGQQMSDPTIDVPAMARAQGLVAFGPVVEANELIGALSSAVDAVTGGRPCVVDVSVEPGYTPGMASGLLRGSEKEAG